MIETFLHAVQGVSIELEQADRLATGLTRLSEAEFDVLLLDLGLPDSQGLDTFLRVRDEVGRVPIEEFDRMFDEPDGGS